MVTNVIWGTDQGRPRLYLELGGQPVHVPMEQKQSLLEVGLVFLGHDWEGRVPVLRYRSDPSNPITRLRGFTRDVEVLHRYQQFARAVLTGTFRPGPRS